MWVIKLGGSLAGSAELPAWLQCLADEGVGKVVIVPGGGPFADAVRQTQQHWKFPDATAHRMALLAMDQYGWMLMGLEPRLKPASSLPEIRERLAVKQVPVWLPGLTLGDHPAIPQSWDVTSDSLAAWLAGELRADGLALVKSVIPADETVSVEDLSRQGVVDVALPGYLAQADFQAVWLGPDDHTEFIRMIRDGTTRRLPISAASSVPGQGSRLPIPRRKAK
jgi:aspartokinase-like uncharacterized kinase